MNLPLFFLRACLAALLLLAALPARLAFGASERLSGGLTASALSFAQFQISPDSSRLVVLGVSAGGERGLYSAPLGGGELRRLDAGRPAEGQVLDFQISPDSATLVYRVAEGSGFRLYAVPLAGGAPTPLDVGIEGDASVGAQLRISPDSRYVVFTTQSEGEEPAPRDLYSAPLAGGAPTRLAAQSDEGGPVLDFQISPDGAYVVYQPGTLLPEARRLYRVPIAGGAPARLSQALSIIGTVISFQISPEGSSVVYQSQREGATGLLRALWSVPLLGGPPARLSATSHTPEDTPDDYLIGAGGTRLVYSTRPSADLWAQGADRPPARQLLSAPMSGGGAITLTAETRVWGEFQLAPDASAVIYRGSSGLTGTALYRAPLAGGAPTLLSSPAAQGGQVLDMQLGSGGHVVFRATPPRSLSPALYAVPLAGGAPITLATTVDRRAPVLVSPDGGRVVYTSGGSNSIARRIFSVQIDGGGGLPLGDALPGNTLASYQISPDGKQLVYALTMASAAPRARAPAAHALYSVPLDGGEPAAFSASAASEVASFTASEDGGYVVFERAGSPEQAENFFGRTVFGGVPEALEERLPAGGVIREVQLSPDGRWSVVRLRALEEGAARERLYLLIPGRSAIPLGEALDRGLSVDAFQLSADGEHVVFRARAPGGDSGLYSVSALDGQLVELSATLAPTATLRDFRLSPDGARVVFRLRQAGRDAHSLYSVAVGGGEPLELSGRALEGGELAITPDSRQIIFPAQGEGGQQLDVAALDGGGGRRLDEYRAPCGPLLALPDSSGVVYQRRLDGPEGRCALYHAPLAEGEPRRLSDALPAEAQLWHARISPDGRHAAVLAQEQAGEPYALFGLPLEGGGAQKLSGALQLRDSSLRAAYRISPDGKQLIFEARGAVGEPFGLYRAPLAGGEPTRLSGPLASGQIGRFELSGDGRRVVYLASHNSPGVVELYGATIDGEGGGGGGEVQRLSGALVAGGDVLDFALAADGGHLIYLADQEQDGVEELFAADFGPPELDASYAIDSSLDTLTVEVQLATRSVLTTTIGYSVQRVDAAGLATGLLARGSLSIAPGEMSASAQEPITRDWIPQSGESIVLELERARDVSLPETIRLRLPLEDRGLVLPLLLR